MLDFLLVLGQIPGTSVQLNFWEIIIITLGAWYGIRLWRWPALRRRFTWRLKHMALFILFPLTSLYRHR